MKTLKFTFEINWPLRSIETCVPHISLIIPLNIAYFLAFARSTKRSNWFLGPPKDSIAFRHQCLQWKKDRVLYETRPTLWSFAAAKGRVVFGKLLSKLSFTKNIFLLLMYSRHDFTNSEMTRFVLFFLFQFLFQTQY